MENTNPTQYLASAYVRLSKEDMNSASGLRSESNSISNQKQLILDFLKDNADIKLVSIREDDGYTGTDYDRPDFQRMMDDIRAGVVNCVVVKDLSRFGREYINAGKYIHHQITIVQRVLQLLRCLGPADVAQEHGRGLQNAGWVRVGCQALLNEPGRGTVDGLKHGVAVAQIGAACGTHTALNLGGFVRDDRRCSARFSPGEYPWSQIPDRPWYPWHPGSGSGRCAGLL